MIEEGKMARVKVDGGVSSGEEHVAEFMDKSLTNTWDKMNPKVSVNTVFIYIVAKYPPKHLKPEVGVNTVFIIS